MIPNLDQGFSERAAIDQRHISDSANIVSGKENTAVQTKSYDRLNFERSDPHLLPIFLHSSFRTSSTWLWSALRKLPTVLGYYEIFNGILSNISEKSIVDTTYSTWDSHHPAQAPYFLEYLLLLKKGGGVIGFDASMALERFIPQGGIDGSLSLEEQAYLNILVEQAHRSRKIPLLSCTRSIGRLPAIKRFMPIHSILIHRNLFDQWSSYTGQFLRGNRFFFDTIDHTAASFNCDTFLRRLNEFLSSRILSPKDEQTFLLFILMHIYLYARSFEFADVVIDTSALATDPDLRRSVEMQLSSLVSAHVDLSDAKSNFDTSIVLVHDRKQFIDTVEQFVKIIASACSSAEAAAFAFKLKDDTLAQWDLHDRLTRNSTMWYDGLTNDLQQKNEEHACSRTAIESALVKIGGERDDAVATLADLEATRITTEAALATVTAERDALAATLAATSASQASAVELVAALQIERDGILTMLAETAEARNAVQETASALEAEHDRIALALATTTVAQAASDTALNALVAERDRLAMSLVDIDAAKAAADETVIRLTADRHQIDAILAETPQARFDAETALTALAAERDSIAADLAETIAAKTLVDHAVITLETERDRIAATLTHTMGAKDAADNALAELQAERDRIAATLVETTAAKASAENAVAELEAERGQFGATLAELSLLAS